MRPTQVTRGTQRKVWWRGEACGHEWEATINSRTNLRSGCPVCSGQRTLVGVTDLANP